jgi:hypothetical protein
MPVKTKKNARVGPRIVRAWFDTVINPLLYGLEIERKVLEAKNCTWRFQPPKLASIAPVRDLVEAKANLDQFLDFQHECQRLSKQHDSQYEELLAACQSLHAVLVKSSKLQNVVEQNLLQLKLPPGKRPEDLFSNYEDRYDVLAEHIVNGTGLLPSYYGIQPVWNKSRDEFLKVRDAHEVHEHYHTVEVAGMRLLSTVNKLIDALKDTRDRLSLKYDEPLQVSAE